MIINVSSIGNDLFTYELGVVEDFYFLYVERKLDNLEIEGLDVCEKMIFINKRLIDIDVLTNDIPGFKTYDEYKDVWIYEWNKDVPWVANRPWLDYGPWMEPSDDIEHVCKLFRFNNGHAKWPTCNWKKEKYCNGGDLPRVIWIGDMIYFKNYEWYENLKDGELKDEALNDKAILEGSKKAEEESSKDPPIDEWEDFECANHIETNIDSNYNPYLDVSRIFNDHVGTTNDDDAVQADHEWFDNHKPMDDNDDDIGDLEDYLIQKDHPYYVNEDEEGSMERRCNLFGIPYVKPPTCKSEKFKVVKYSFRPAKECVAIMEYEYVIWVRTKENVSQVYNDIFCNKDKGWSVRRTK
ncbi:hypothetical protein Tco_0945356 [Tanacetum coccineum]